MPTQSRGVTPHEINEFVIDAFPGSAYECVEVGVNHALLKLNVDSDHIRPGGFISGPTQFALTDGALWAAADCHKTSNERLEVPKHGWDQL